jgi:hypothetical protein
MFSNTAYEALFEYIGLELHSRFIEVLTSQRMFMAIVFMIFATMFFLTTAHFFSRYLPGTLVKRRSVPLSKYVKVVVCLVIGLSVLRVGSTTEVKRFSGESWHTNSYITSKSHNVQPEYRVSFVFDLLSRTAEEMTRLLNQVVDQMFRSTNSEIEAPSFFYKAVMYAGAASLNDPDLRSDIEFYTEECIPRILPLIGNKESLDRLDGLYRSDLAIDDKLAALKIESEGATTNCLDAKNDIRTSLISYTRDNSDTFRSMLRGYVGDSMSDQTWINLQVSMNLVEHYLEQREGFSAIQKGSQPNGGFARIYQYMNRLFHLDTWVGGLNQEWHGASLAAERSQEFSENLSRAPHVAGFIKLALIAIFPWLVFPIVAGYWRVLIWWMLGYTSVLLWAPIWTLFYHVMMGITLSTDTLAAFGELSDGISLYSANLVTSRMNYMYAVYSWIQLLIGAGFTGSILWFARPILSDSEQDSAPEFVGDVGSLTRTAGRML